MVVARRIGRAIGYSSLRSRAYAEGFKLQNEYSYLCYDGSLIETMCKEDQTSETWVFVKLQKSSSITLFIAKKIHH